MFTGGLREGSNASDQEGFLSPVFGGWSLEFTLSWREDRPLLNFITLGEGTLWTLDCLPHTFLLLHSVLRCVGQTPL